MSRLQGLYNFMDRSALNRRLVGSAIAFILFGMIFLTANGLINAVQDKIERDQIAKEIEKVKNAPAKDYVNFYSVTVSNASLGDLPRLTLCRKLPQGTVKIDAVRTFIKLEDGQQKQVLERGFKAAIEQSITNTDCTSVDLIGQPQSAGKYQIFTDYSFTVESHGQKFKKSDSYRSNEYEMRGNLKELKDRLDALQEQYDLQSNATGASAESSSSAIASNDTPASSTSQNQSTSKSSGSSTSGGSGESGNSGSGGSSGGGNNNSGGGSSNNSGLTLDLPLLPPIKLFGN